MIKKKDLTNEQLTKLFKNPFDLVNCAIHIAHQVVGNGRELKEGVNKNIASQILCKILKDHETEKQSESMLEGEKHHHSSHDKDFPTPLLEAV